ncbi:MAG: CYTH domain-containing protein [Bacteroidales bacterium]|nr:CYTH domain-containing protein [Bacteroidales bacterium]
MHIETERKFLVRDDSYKKEAVKSYRIKQGYIAHDGGNTVRVRIRDNEGFLTIKGPSRNGMSRAEWEKLIPVADAEALLQLCHGGFIDKTRHVIPCGELFWEVDEFHGDNEGLTMAEIELPGEEVQFPRPSWLAEEVTGDKRYYNSFLTRFPYKVWQ